MNVCVCARVSRCVFARLTELAGSRANPAARRSGALVPLPPGRQGVGHRAAVGPSSGPYNRHVAHSAFPPRRGAYDHVANKGGAAGTGRRLVCMGSPPVPPLLLVSGVFARLSEPAGSRANPGARRSGALAPPLPERQGAGQRAAVGPSSGPYNQPSHTAYSPPGAELMTMSPTKEGAVASVRSCSEGNHPSPT